MGNHTTGAQRRNARMDKIFAQAETNNKKYGNALGLHGSSHESALKAKKK